MSNIWLVNHQVFGTFMRKKILRFGIPFYRIHPLFERTGVHVYHLFEKVNEVSLPYSILSSFPHSHNLHYIHLMETAMSFAIPFSFYALVNELLRLNHVGIQLTTLESKS